ncbi:hypothetical protein [Pseudofrankia inefficax]|nr:hypothetical protein [Pseudofrankia inefficax]
MTTAPGPMTLAAWEQALERVTSAPDVLVIQVDPAWFTDPTWADVRDGLDLLLFRRTFGASGPFSLRRMMLYDPPSDTGGDATRYQRAVAEHGEWTRRVRRQLAACGAAGSAGKAMPAGQDYEVRQLILDRVGAAQPPPIPDGIWFGNAPGTATAAWATPGLIPLDPHEDQIIGPHRDRNPLWQGAFLD